jgi:hypothetical protein
MWRSVACGRCDRAGADPFRVIGMMRTKLKLRAVPIQVGSQDSALVGEKSYSGLIAEQSHSGAEQPRCGRMALRDRARTLKCTRVCISLRSRRACDASAPGCAALSR